MPLIDTHVHLNFSTLQDDIDAIAANWRQAGVVRLVHSCVEPGEFEAIAALADRFPEILFAVGLHPLDVEHLWSDDMTDVIERLATSDSRVVAIGETGLDLFKAENYRQQADAFIAQLDIAHRLGLPVIVHCRDAAQEMVSLLREYLSNRNRTQVLGVMHCWGGTPEEAQWFLDLGFYISFSGIVTFKNAIQVQETAKLVPDDRILIETDCPFLTPVPHRGRQQNQPAFVLHVAEMLAKLRNTDLDAIASQTAFNAGRLFNFDVPRDEPSLKAV